jgi:hypothetical protein
MKVELIWAILLLVVTIEGQQKRAGAVLLAQVACLAAMIICAVMP